MFQPKLKPLGSTLVKYVNYGEAGVKEKRFDELTLRELVFAIEHISGAHPKEIAEDLNLKTNSVQKWRYVGCKDREGPTKILLQLMLRELILQ